MAVTGSQKEGVTIEQLRSIDRRAVSADAASEQRSLLGVDEPRQAGTDWPLTGPANPEDVKPSADELDELTPSDDEVLALTGEEEEA